MLNFTSADTKRQSTKCSVSARVTVATDDRKSRLRQAEFWSNNMNDPLFARVDVEKLNTKLGAVFPKCIDLSCRSCVCDRQATIGSWNVVIYGSDGQVRTPHFASGLTQSGKRLGRRYLVNEMEIDVDESWLTLGFANDVTGP